MKLTAELVNQSRMGWNALHEMEIDLRGNKIAVVENLGSLQDQVDVLDLTDNEVEVLENFPRMVRLKWIMLSNNHVARIQPDLHEAIPNLEVLVLANNRISLLSEIDKLAGFKRLKLLNLADNPVRNQRHYRLYVIHKIPPLELLDYDRVRQKERKEADSLFSSQTGKQFVQGVKTQGQAMAKDFSHGGVILSDEQKRIILNALQNATTEEEIQRFQKMLTSGVVPDEATLAALLKKSNDHDVEMETRNMEIENSSKQDKSAGNEVQLNQSEEGGDNRMEFEAKAPKQVEETREIEIASDDDKIANKEKDTSWIEDLTVKQLRAELKARDLSGQGRKAELRERLKNALK